jgi:FkbM family methyltransferase
MARRPRPTQLPLHVADVSFDVVAKKVFALDELEELLQEEPIILVDAGARGGIPKHWRPVEPWLRVIGFEPDARSLDSLDESDRRRTFPKALASRPGSVTLHLTAEAGDSSVLVPNRPFVDRFPRAERFDVVGTQTVSGDTLDNQLAADGIDRVDFIKLDTQGSELMILEGARQTLGRGVFGVEVEVELNPIYQQQPLFSDVDRFLRSLGYELFDLELRRWKHRAGEDLALTRGQVAWGDALFLLDPERTQLVVRQGDDLSVPTLARIVSICLLYNLGDYALALLDSLGEAIGEQLRTAVTRSVRTYDAASETGSFGLTTRASAEQMRRLRELCNATGTRPGKQLRAALASWLDTPARTA